MVSLLLAGSAVAAGCGGDAQTSTSTEGAGGSGASTSASSSTGQGGGGVGGGVGGGGVGGGGVGGGSGGSGGGACVPAIEVCDGADNDCDNAIDEDLVDVTCGLGACQVTVPGCEDGAPVPCTPLPPAAVEACEGTDDDCDGAVDEGCRCVDGQTQSCYSGPPGTQGMGACKAGSQVCQGGAWGPCEGDVVPAAEACDGIDNSCDGQVDDGNPGAGQVCSTGLPGACAPGKTACVSGIVVCNQDVAASAEACDGADNNCNGQVDDGNPGGGVACMTGLSGVCASGTTVCSGGSIVCGQNVQPSAEACDQLDNNCNGQPDEGNPGGGVACMTGLSGVCAAGTTSCVSGAVVCNQNVAASAEACDGLDNNCNGQLDDGNPGGGVACMTGKPGVCAAGTTTCMNGALACAQNAQPTAEACDGVDNDCDGQADEGNPGGGGACGTGQPGLCSAGTLACSGGALVCTQNVQPAQEVCGDNLDNDCDGQADESCSACNTSVLVLSDSNASPNQQIVAALQNAGLNPTLLSGGADTYANVPLASSFGAVLLLVGDLYLNDMPLAGQNGIVNAFNAGTTGVLFTEWSAYHAHEGRWAVLKQLLILDRSGEDSFSDDEQTYTNQVPHPVWTGLPGSFTTATGSAPMAANVGAVINGGTSIALLTASGCSTCPAPGVVVKGGPSRTVQIAHSANYAGGGTWISDVNLRLMFTNGAKWAAECL